MSRPVSPSSGRLRVGHGAAAAAAAAAQLRPLSTLTTALWTLLTHWIYNPVANFILSLHQQME